MTRFSVKIFSNRTKLEFQGGLDELPRVDDRLRLSAKKFLKVVEVVWCLDEEKTFGQRINIAAEIEK